MKPASIIFLIVSVIVIIVGLVLCTAGVNMAKSQNIALFSTDVSEADGNVIRNAALSDSAISKVKINVGDVDVIILASETGESYLEFYNFQVGSYDYSVQNKMLLFDNETSIFSLMHIGEGNFSFDGLRHYLTYKPGAKDAQKKLYLYLNGTEEIKTFDITCRHGTVQIEDLKLNADYNISLGSGKIQLKNITTKSNVNLSVDSGYVMMDRVSCRGCNGVVGEGGCDILLSRIPGNCTIDVQRGDIYAGFTINSPYGMELTLNASGIAKFNGEVQEQNPAVVSANGAPVSFTAERGNVEVQIAAEDIMHCFDDAEIPSSETLSEK